MEQAQENKPTVDMKKVVWIGVNAALVTLLLGAVIAYFVQKSRFTEFHDEYYKISIKYPKSWAVKRDIAGALVTFLRRKIMNSTRSARISIFQYRMLHRI